MKIIFHPDYILHQHRGMHPERPERLESVMGCLESSISKEDIITPIPTDEKSLSKVHSEGYIQRFKNHPCGYLDGGDTYIGEKTYEISKMAAGGALIAGDIANKGEPVMALLRPPGHHAGSYYGGGFCYFNNIALAAAHSKVDRVAILDLDGHHGNGTSDIFYTDKNVLFISTHHYGIYPGTGESIAIGDGDGEGYNINIPFGTGAGDSSYEYAWNSIIAPVLMQYEPEIILVSLGIDGHYADGMTGLSLSSQAYISLAEKSMELSRKINDGKIAFFLEGGYHLGSLSEIVKGIISLGCGGSTDLTHTEVYDDKCIGKKAAESTIHALKDHWEF